MIYRWIWWIYGISIYIDYGWDYALVRVITRLECHRFLLLQAATVGRLAPLESLIQQLPKHVCCRDLMTVHLMTPVGCHDGLWSAGFEDHLLSDVRASSAPARPSESSAADERLSSVALVWLLEIVIMCHIERKYTCYKFQMNKAYYML